MLGCGGVGVGGMVVGGGGGGCGCGCCCFCWCSLVGLRCLVGVVEGFSIIGWQDLFSREGEHDGLRL